MEEIVNKILIDLTELYRRMVGQIQQLKRGNPKLYQLIVLIVTTSYCPLSLRELSMLSRLLELVAGQTKDIETLMKICGSLFTVQDGVVYVIH